MAVIAFYGKPDCVENRRQRDRLIAAGHTVIERNISKIPWTSEHLYSFLKSRPFEAWFDRSAPGIVAGHFVPDILTDTEALNAMLVAPGLIQRPLLEFDEFKLCGFDAEELDALIGMDPATNKPRSIGAFPRNNVA